MATANFFLIAVFVIGANLHGVGAMEEKKERFDTFEYKKDGFLLNNNVWNHELHGPQTIWAESYQKWGVHSKQPNDKLNDVKSYPNVGKDINKKLNQLHHCDSTYGVKLPNEGTYDCAYDIWLNNEEYEIMVWVNYKGDNVNPIASYDAAGKPVPVEKVKAGGHDNEWELYSGTNGKNKVYSFVTTKKNTDGSVDILDLLKHLENKGYFGGDATLSKVQFGWEIFTSSQNGDDYSVHKYDLQCE